MPARNPDAGSKRRILDIDVEIGRQVRVERSLRGVKQTELARAVGVSFQQLQKYENGINRITAGKLFKIAQHLKLPVAYFFAQIEPDFSGDTDTSGAEEYRQAVAFAKSALGQHVCGAFSKIRNKETQRTLLRLMETLSQQEG